MGLFNGTNGQQPAAGQEQNNQAEKPEVKGFVYRCVRACTYGGKVYKEGEIMIQPEKKETPHFKLVEQAGA